MQHRDKPGNSVKDDWNFSPENMERVFCLHFSAVSFCLLRFLSPELFFLISKIQREGNTQNIKLWISGEGDSVKLSKELQAICVNSFAGPCPAAAWWVDTCTGHEQGTPSFDHGHSFS
jgi:hypothetical protein